MRESDTARATARLVASEVIFGTLGLFVRLLPLSSTALAAARGLFGSLFLLVFVRLTGIGLKFPKERRLMVLLVASGVCLTLNWALLFEAYSLTTLATAELAYEMAPAMVMAVSPFVLKERLTRTRCVCLALALVGIVAVSGVLEPGATEGVTLEGIAFGLGAATFYAAVMILNRFLKEIDNYTTTIVQLGVAGLVLVPRLVLTGDTSMFGLDARCLLLLGIVVLVHTGVAFILWFSSFDELSAQKVAIFNYIDPAVAIISSALIFHEALTPLATVGAVLILGSTLASELLERRAA